MTPQDFCRKLQISETCAPLVQQAMVHRSALAEGQRQSNELLEFLGDAVLELIVTEYLFQLFPHHQEGDLSRARALIVSRLTLAEAALQLEVDQMLCLSSGEEAQGGRRRTSILAGAFEALVAAIYLCEGLEGTRQFVWRTLGEVIQQAPYLARSQDYKSCLQEKAHALWKITPTYAVVAEYGADHDKTFHVQVTIGDKVWGEGVGKSKKQAEQIAAREALRRLEELSLE